MPPLVLAILANLRDCVSELLETGSKRPGLLHLAVAQNPKHQYLAAAFKQLAGFIVGCADHLLVSGQAIKRKWIDGPLVI